VQKWSIVNLEKTGRSSKSVDYASLYRIKSSLKKYPVKPKGLPPLFKKMGIGKEEGKCLINRRVNPSVDGKKE
jgi:hypothetical protein